VTPAPSAGQMREVFARFRPIGLDTNFFEAGFSSPTLVEVLEGLRGLGLTLTLIDLYRFPTVRLLAAEAARRASPDARGSARAELPWDPTARAR
jgi:Phosphopantetheine attachment site